MLGLYGFLALLSLPVKMARRAKRIVWEWIDLDRIAGPRGAAIPGESDAEWIVRIIRTDPVFHDAIAQALARNMEGVEWTEVKESMRCYWRGLALERAEIFVCGGRFDDPMSD
jgi:hypothetical protein